MCSAIPCNCNYYPLPPHPYFARDGKDIKYFLLPQWCDGAPPQVNSKGRDYCKGAQVYAGVPLDFENLVIPRPARQTSTKAA